MKVDFVKVDESSQELLANLAGEIWQEYWPALIGQDQTDYMVEQFQSLEAIKRQMAEEAYEYWFVVVPAGRQAAENAWRLPDGRAIVGFTGGHDEPETNRFFISKIYLLSCERGKHYASVVISFYYSLCLKRGFEAAYLTVNKYNEMGIRAYKAKGFKTIDSVETDIGHGFIMDDYIMEMEIKPLTDQ